jgi:hypothetical protein
MTPKIDHHRVDRIIRECREYKLKGWDDGSAYRSHPVWIRRGQLLLVSHWHVDDICHVSVITDPAACVRSGMDDSLAHGNPFPKVDKGTLESVWYCGGWKVEGPWCQELERLLDELDVEIKDAKAVRERIQNEERAQREAHEREGQENLRRCFVASDH